LWSATVVAFERVTIIRSAAGSLEPIVGGLLELLKPSNCTFCIRNSPFRYSVALPAFLVAHLPVELQGKQAFFSVKPFHLAT
jgi:hypothetical protein